MPTLFDLIQKLSQSQENVVADGLVPRYTAVNTFLLAQTEIRILIPNSQNFGHQSSSVNVLRNLIRMGCTANFTLALYADEDRDFTDLVAKIKLLIPQFTTLDQAFQLGGCNVTATKLIPDSFQDIIPLGITGGFDDGEQKVPPLSSLKVANYVQLQPYAWSRGTNSVAKLNDGVWTTTDLDTTYSATLLSRRAFYLPQPVITLADWTAINATAYAEKGRIVQYLLTSNKTNITVWPVYGISTPDRGTPYASLYNIASAAIAAKAEHWEAAGFPTVIALISELDEMNWNIFQDLALDPSELSSRGGGLYSGARINVSADLVAWGRTDAVNDHISFIGGPGVALTATQVTAKIATLTDKDVLVVYLGKIPTVLFNQLYAEGSFPGVFEGQNTAELMLNLGKPYFKVNTNLGTFYDYPTLPLTAQLTDAHAQSCMLSSNNGLVLSLPTNWRSGTALYPPTTLLPIIGAYMDAEHNADLAGYFSNLGQFFHQENEDKLLRGLDLLVNFLRTAAVPGQEMAVPSLETADDNQLEQLYERLQNATTDGVLKLLQVFTSGIVYDFFSSVVDDTLFTITDANTTINADKTLVTLTGNTAALLGTAPVNVNFTIQDGKLNTVLIADFSSTAVTFPGAEWFTFSAPKLTVELNEGSAVPALVSISMDLQVGISLNIALTIPSEEDNVLIKALFTDDNASLSQLFQLVGGINLSAYLPSQIQLITDIQAQEIEFKYNYKTNKVAYIGVNLGTPAEQTWNLIPGVSVAQLQMGAQVTDPANLATRQTAYEIKGQFNIADATVGIDAFYPSLRVSGGLTDDSKPLLLSALIKEYLGDAFTQALPGAIQNIQITDLNFLLDQPSGNYSFGMSVDTQWDITVGSVTPFSIVGLGFNIEATSKTIDPPPGGGQSTTTDITGSFSGNFVLLPNSETSSINLTTSAAYLGTDKGWTFSARQTSGVISIGGLLQEYLGWTTGLDFNIDGLSVTLMTSSNAWEFNGKTADPWVTPIGTYSGKAKIGYTGDQVKEVGHYGEIDAEISWNGIDLTVFYNFDPSSSKYGITWGILTGYIENKNDHQVATLKFNQPTTLGSIVETMISWATGTTFGLGSPWNLLNSVPLNGLSLIYDFTAESVSFGIDIGPIDLGFITVNGINISYNTKDPDPAKNGVIVKLDVSGAWGDVPEWNAADPSTTPAPPGQGNKYLDLRLLALGQHVTLDCFKTADNVQAAIACMETLPEVVDHEIPTDLHLDSNSSWLIGMDFGVLKLEETKSSNAVALATDAAQYFLTMQIVFNDPNLYALRIALEGEPAKIFKGLDFQIMYKKISDTVGVYQAEITLPDVMRKIEMGQINLTLPVFGIAVYTNGDFQVDIGFPWKADFSRSFTFQTLIWTPIGIPIPVMGSAGVYFGKLSSATTNKVPATTTGTFNPVLVFGFGMQFGLGYSFDAGILSAGFSLTAVAILEGVLAKWNPYAITDAQGNNVQLGSSYYFWFRGTVGIIGKLYGSVDFAIVKAELNIDIRLLIQMTFSPYDPIELALTASVSVSLRITINLGLFKIHVSFSFSASINQTVTIDAIAGPAPWASGMSLAQPRRRRIHHNRATLLTAYSTTNPVWSNLQNATTVTPLTAYIGLGLTVAGDNAAQPFAQVPCYVSMLFIDSVPPPQDAREDGRRKAYGVVADTSFEFLAKQVFRWAIASIQSGPLSSADVDKLVVTDLQLQALLQYLTNPTPITVEDINAFMTGQFSLTVNAPTTEGDANATYFPVPPQMSIQTPDYGSDYQGVSYSFGAYNQTSSAYTDFLRDYFAQLAVQLEQSSSKEFALNDANGISLGSFIFGDYFLLICRQMLQSARQSLQDFKYFPTEGQTVQDIVQWINQQSGTTLYQVEELFTDNVSAPLNAGKTLRISGSAYVIQEGDTFNLIAGQSIFNKGFTGTDLAKNNKDTANILQAGITVQYPGEPGYKTLPGQSLTAVAKAIGIPVTDLIDKSNIVTLPGLLLPVATLALPDFNGQTSTGDTLNSIAAAYRITQQQLAAPAANALVSDLFDSTYLSVAHLGQFNVGELIKEIQATNGLQHLSGMTSKYYMAGLRLPTDGITPAYKGMWVTDNNGVLSLPAFAGLYALTGQQFPLPLVTKDNNFDIVFSKESGLTWMDYAGNDPTQLTFSLVYGSYSAQQISAVTGVATGGSLPIPLSSLGTQDAFISTEATYPLTTQIIWNSAAPYAMPYGAAPGGVPALSCWQIPDTLLQLPDPQTRAVNPRVSLQVGRYDESSQTMVNTPVSSYGYGSLVSFTIKKVPAIADSPTTLTTYEVMGADGSNAALLEKMVSGVGSNNDAIATLTFAYGVDTNGTTTQGIQTDAPDALTIGIAQVNLSTETRPDSLSTRLFQTPEDQQNIVLLNEPTDMIRLLWQASITRGGGYYLYYFNDSSKAGLPDRIFNDKNEATLSLLVLYAAPKDIYRQNNVTDYMNVIATGQAIDTTQSVLFAQADPYLYTIASDDVQTLAALAYDYYGNTADVATDNELLQLRNGIPLTVGEGVYEVGPNAPGGSPAAIATWFGTTIDAIKAANPLQTDWSDPLPLYTALFLPRITVMVGTSNGGTTLQDISQYYGEPVTALAAENSGVAGIFADNQTISLQGGPDIRSSTVPPGVAAIEAIRPAAPDIPGDPSDANYGLNFLLNAYSLLSYQVANNNYFKVSNLGLPAAPKGVAGGSKMNYPQAADTSGNWTYNQSIPYSRFTKQSILTADDMPPASGSPYLGLGSLLQIDFAWQDYYGNRIITTLSQPSPQGPLNQPPMLTGYTDPLIGLNQWPSVSSSWQCQIPVGQTTPELQVSLSFSDNAYQGLLWVKSPDAHTVTCWFTEPLDATSANNSVNYSADNGITVQKATLAGDGQTVTLQVDNVPANLLITVRINNVSNLAKTETYSGSAQFGGPDATASIITQAQKDLQVYTQLWYQLTDPNGIAYTVETSLLQDPYTLSAAQVQGLVQQWIASIYLFLQNRALGRTDVAVPEAIEVLAFAVDMSLLNPEQIFRLDLSFSIARTRNQVAADLETTGGILQATAQVTPLTETEGSDTHSLDTFTSRFEAALVQPGEYALRIATGTDREDASNAKEVWAVRLGLAATPLAPISYRITNENDPDIFAPRPISNKLESRRQVPLYYYSEQNGIDFTTPSTYMDFTGIDMDKWGQQFFSSVDNVLSPEFTAAIQLVDNKKGTTHLQTLLDNKKSLAGIVKQWMIPVFQGETADTTGAQEAFLQLLLQKLANAYTVQAAIQFQATVGAEPAKDIAPRLYGNINRNFKFIGAMVDAEDNTLVSLFFTTPPDPAAAAIAANFTATGGLSVNTAAIDPQNNRRVILQLSAKATAGTTQITVSNGFVDMTGTPLLPPLSQTALALAPEYNNSDAITFTSPKLSLQNGQEADLPFLLNAPQIVRGTGNELLPYVDLDLSFAGSAIEHQIGLLPNIADYEASSWLTFVTPPGNDSPLKQDLGKIQVPIVLREFPTAPSMVNQTGQASASTNAQDIGQDLNWDYSVQYSLPIHYPQDQLDFTVNFNVEDQSNTLLTKGLEDAFPQLAEFIGVSASVYAVLQSQLTQVTAETSDTDPILDTASTALRSYNQLVSNIVTAAEPSAFAISAPPRRLGSNQVLPYSFSIKEGNGTIGETQALVISVTGIPPAGIGQPLVNVPGYTAQAYTGACSGDYCYYYTNGETVLPASQGQTIQDRTIVLPAMNILARQDAASSATLKRNVELVPGKPSADAFVYTTGAVAFSNPYHPTNDQGAPIDISEINAPSGGHNFVPLATQLTNLFGALLAENSQDTLTFLMSCQYTYQINPGIIGISLPVMMQPLQDIQVKGVGNHTTLAEMIAAWAGSMTLWYNTVNPGTSGGTFGFDLTIFSNLTEQPLPLVRLRSLELGVEYITDL